MNDFKPIGLSPRSKFGGVAVIAAVLLCIGVIVLSRIFALGQQHPGSEPLWTFLAGQLKTKLLPADFATPSASITNFNSVFFEIQAEGSFVDVARDGAGGGLTPFGDGVVLLTHEGRIFFSNGVGNVNEIAIKVPDNGFKAYKAASEKEKYRGYQFALEWHRYNDILYIDNGETKAFAISFTEFQDASDCYTTTVALLTMEAFDDDLSNVSAQSSEWRTIFRTHPCLPLKKEYRAIEGHIAGGRLAFKRPYSLLLASGDYHWDGVYAPEALAHRLDNDYGKVIEIDIRDYSSTRVSYGLRNMQGIVVDPDGRIWTVEHGPRGGDELNLIIPGRHYGWPLETFGTDYTGEPWPLAKNVGRHEMHEPPVFAWLPSVATSGMTLVRGFHDSWDGDLLVSTFKSNLIRIRIRGERAVFAERIPTGLRVRDVQQTNDGRIAIWTDDKRLLFLSVVPRATPMNYVSRWMAQSNLTTSEKQQLSRLIDRCLECHSFSSNDNSGGPSLAKVFESDIASTSYRYYSNSLREAKGKWTQERLIEYINNPKKFARGTTMPASVGNDKAALLNLMRLLQDLRAQDFSSN